MPDDAGILVPPGDSVALADALATVMGDDGTLDRLADGARMAREGLTDWDETCGQFAAELGELG